MPEGPSIVILREEAEHFVGHNIERVQGNSKIDQSRLHGQPVIALRTWGKHFLIELPQLTVRIHLLLFGSYRIAERREMQPRLSLGFDNGELNFYACSVQIIDGPLDEHYDWSADVMSDRWDAAQALKKLQAIPTALICDALLDQTIFAGAGNIFKNEVLFRLQIHPLSQVGALPAAKLRELVKQMRVYAFEFYEWKKAFVLKKHWQAHRQSLCPRCDIRFTKTKLGRTHRQSFFCENCQQLYELTAAEKTPKKVAKKAVKKIAPRSKPELGAEPHR